jgi:hypothetical protein
MFTRDVSGRSGWGKGWVVPVEARQADTSACRAETFRIKKPTALYKGFFNIPRVKEHDGGL